MNIMKKILTFGIFMSLLLTSCNGLKMEVGLKGELLEDNKMILDGDTFDIKEKIGDSLFVVWDYGHAEGKNPYYLLKYERNGFYYPKVGAKEMCSIDNTKDFVGINEKEVYDIKEGKVLFMSPCDVLGLRYIDKWKDKLLFASSDTICFSDGKCVGLQKNVSYEKPKGNGTLTLVDGAQKINVSFADLYNATKMNDTEKDISVEKLVRDYYIKPRSKYESVEAGFEVDLDVPKGNSKADKAIRQWMMAAIADDAFSLLEDYEDIPKANVETLDALKSSLDGYGALWEKLCRIQNQVGDTLVVRLIGDIKVSKVADCDDYVTYHYWASLYSGGIHELLHGYYITYDKRREGLLDVCNSIKPEMMLPFRKMVLESLKAEYDLRYEKKSSWDEFTSCVFSFHCPSIDVYSKDDVVRSLLEHYYSCDEWAGWNGYNEEAFDERNFPLTHFAVLPEGIVLTYHPYQIDCFAAGEYHAVVPFKEANQCLVYDYSKHEKMKPGLKRFIK